MKNIPFYHPEFDTTSQQVQLIKNDLSTLDPIHTSKEIHNLLRNYQTTTISRAPIKKLTQTQTTPSPLKTILRNISSLSIKNTKNLLKRYTDENTIKTITDKVDLRQLLATLLYIEEHYPSYGTPELTITINEENNEFQFINIILKEDNWETWGKIAKEIKEEMKKAGLNQLTSKIAIVCPQAL